MPVRTRLVVTLTPCRRSGAGADRRSTESCCERIAGSQLSSGQWPMRQLTQLDWSPTKLQTRVERWGANELGSGKRHGRDWKITGSSLREH